MPTMFQVRGRTFRGVEPSSPPTVFGIVVDEHVVRNGQDVAIHVHRCGNHHLQGIDKGPGEGMP